MAHYSEFGLDPNNFKLTPDFVVRFALYCNALQDEIAEHFIQTGEKIPAQTMIDRVCSEFQMSEENVDRIFFAGTLIQMDREINQMTPEEKEAFDQFTDKTSEMILEVISEVLPDVIESARKRDEEVERLNKMFDL